MNVIEDGARVYTSCGIVHSSVYKNDYENMYKILRKCVYNRKYHIEKVLNTLALLYFKAFCTFVLLTITPSARSIYLYIIICNFSLSYFDFISDDAVDGESLELLEKRNQ